MRNIFLGKSYTKCGGETSPRHFYKRSNLSITLDQPCEMLKNKNVRNWSTCLIFCMIFEMFLTLYLVNWPNFIVWLPVFLEILGNMCRVMFFFIVRNCSFFMGIIFCSSVALVWTFKTRGVYNFITKKANIPVKLVPLFNGVSFLFCCFLKSRVTNELKSLFS